MNSPAAMPGRNLRQISGGQFRFAPTSHGVFDLITEKRKENQNAKRN
jgi:hypothetical protein